MDSPKFSVIIPTYNHANYLAEAIQSVLDQTFQNFEIIVIDDASQDHTVEVVSQFDDPRIKFIVHKENRGPAATRNTGIRASSGELIAFLDADDLFHPEKLAIHRAFLKEHPDIDVTYNSRFELNYSAKTIRGLVRPPLTVTLSDLVLGFPFATSDMVLQRKWLFRVGLFEESFVWSEELELNCKLAFAGCRFASVDRALNYRRHESGRIFKNLATKFDSAIRALEKIFTDPRCPTDVLALRPTAFINIYLDYGYLALKQGEISLGQELVLEAARLNPAILEGKPCKLAAYLLRKSIADERLNHEMGLQTMFARLPTEMARLSEQYDWAVAHGYVLKGIRAVMWDRLEDGSAHFSRAIELKAKVDELFLQELTYQLLSFEIEFGPEATEKVLRSLAPYLEKVGSRRTVRRLTGCYMVNQAFQSYRAGDYAKVREQVMKAVANDPKYLLNRGVMAILFRSTIDTRLQREG